MIPFETIAKLFSSDLEGRFCVEIEFLVKDSPRYQSCWMGKMPNREHREKEDYWYGLVSDGSEAYDYDNFQDFSTAPVFAGQSLREIWDSITLVTIDGCDPEEYLSR
ncbi:MAG: hypothetical protein E7469_08240 [Ruminococcaceae bacterium]|nr:hypothetical protein [Oscillospiraceae bacterium]